MKIRIEEYNSEWKEIFKEEAKAIKRALGRACYALCHVGSTSVKGLSARPIVDILLVARDAARFDAKREALEALGYAPDPDEREALRYKKEGEIAVSLVVLQKSDEETIKTRIAVRNYLRCHMDEAKKYQERKCEMAENASELSDYLRWREPVVAALEETAMLWQKREDRLANHLLIGVSSGVGIGFLLGLAFSSLLIGLGLGLCLGGLFGVLLDMVNAPNKED